MTESIPVTNHGASPLFVGGSMIPPGETRLFHKHELPPEYWPDQKSEEGHGQTEDPLIAVSELPIARLALGLPDLSDDELLRLEKLEQAKEKPRQGALAEITSELLRRAENSTPGGLGQEDQES